MAIAQLTHLHLTIPSSGSTSELVPSDCYQVVPLSRSAISHRVSFARDAVVMESLPLLLSPAEEQESLTALTKRDTEPLDRDLIQFTQPAYVLFPNEEPMDDSDGVSTLGFPSLPTPLGFNPIFRSRLTPLHTLIHHQRFPDHQDVLRLCLTLSPIAFMDAPFAVLLTGLWIMLSRPESMGCRCTNPGFWNGSALRSRLVCWIRVLVLGGTRPVNRPLTLPANFTGTCAS